MKKIIGFKIGKRLTQISRWIIRKTRIRSRYQRLNPPKPACRSKPIAKLITWGRRLTNGAKSLCSTKPGSGYEPVGDEEKSVQIPKGHLAIYIGQNDRDCHRVLVPVIYFNHPLFGELLKEAEKEYGFNQQGGITIPCGFSEFERVQTRIAAGSTDRKLLWRRHQTSVRR